MNGFTNAILSLLLGWMRVFINSLWKLMNSEGGGHVLQFLTQQWKALLLILCVGGFVVDRIIYLIRWRPYYVWKSRRRLRREQKGYRADPAEPEVTDEVTGEAAWDGHSPYAPYPVPEIDEPVSETRVAAAIPQAGFAYSAVPQPIIPPKQPMATTRFAPMAQGSPSGRIPFAQPYAPPADLSPVFDEAPGMWDEGDTLVKPLSHNIHTLSDGMEPAFGASMPEPIDYIRDMQAGFARPVPPEQLYEPPLPFRQDMPLEAEASGAPDERGPVHPGLDLDHLRRSIGLSPASSLAPKQETGSAPAFQPYAETRQIRQEEAQAAHSRNPFANLAKKARGFVGVTEEEDKPSIRDLQPTVDVYTAFHEPVYPRPMLHKDGDDT